MSAWSINLSKLKGKDLPTPFGYTRDQAVENKGKSNPEQKALLEKKLWDIATAGKMQILMSLFMMWMTGNNINIVLIFLVFKGVSSAITGVLDVNKVFKDLETSGQNLIKYKAVYLAINLILLGIVINKLMNVGLLPTSPSDWIDLIPPYSQNVATIPA